MLAAHFEKCSKNNPAFYAQTEYKHFRTSIERAEIFVDYGKIDFGFMDRFISAVKKLAIKEVVLYSDRKIAATRKAALSTRCEV